jgi:hypothetical protein
LPRRWLILALGAVGAGFLGVGALSSLRPSATRELRGARLGLSLADTRDRFAAPPGGAWSSESSPEPVLRWAPGAQASDLRAATFEFHQGMLVAVRLRLARSAPEASGASLEITRASLLARATTSDGEVELTLLSRSCPTHADEVKRLITSAR